MSEPRIITFRTDNRDAVVLFLHGFGGHPAKTWGDLPRYLIADHRLHNWDVVSLGYPTTLRLDVPLWRGDPAIDVLGKSLSTCLMLPPLAKYRAVAIVAHSMGGLVAQHALLEPAVAGRVSHCFLFGTPSGGLLKARYGGLIKRQILGMDPEGPFLTSLRARWNAAYAERTPFSFISAQGELDRFVPEDSSLSPFPEAVRRVVPGDHTSMIKPDLADDLCVKLIVEGLLGTGRVRTPVDSARVAVEQREFQRAIELFLPRATDLDDSALAQLSLALDGVGRSAEALEVLARREKFNSTDAIGILAGRIKRRWLVEREERDWQRALELYSDALATVLENSEGLDYAQAAYHTINIAFLELMRVPPYSRTPTSVAEWAVKASGYADMSPPSHWRTATLAESQLIQRNINDAVQLYRHAANAAPSARAVDSMYTQAITIAEAIGGTDAVLAVEEAFGLGS